VTDQGSVRRPAAAGGDVHVEEVERMRRSRLPNLIMVGPGKAGTTSFHWYLSQHPSICPADVKEIRYFAPITHGEHRLPPLEEYARHFDECGEQTYRLEASPQYFHGGAPLIASMKRALGSPRVIITLRDPVGRLWSTYRSLKVRRTLPPSATFESYVAACEKVRADRAPLTRENRAHWTLSGGFYVEHIRPWLDEFGDDLRITFFEHLVEDPAAVVAATCRWLQIDDRCVASFSYTRENETVSNRSRILHRIALAANSEGLLRDRRRLKAPLRRAYYAMNGRRQGERLPAATRDMLVRTFEEPNEALAAELRARGYAKFPSWLSASASRGADPAH
jgi:Sulfotransferase domain